MPFDTFSTVRRLTALTASQPSQNPSPTLSLPNCLGRVLETNYVMNADCTRNGWRRTQRLPGIAKLCRSSRLPPHARHSASSNTNKGWRYLPRLQGELSEYARRICAIALLPTSVEPVIGSSQVFAHHRACRLRDLADHAGLPVTTLTRLAEYPALIGQFGQSQCGCTAGGVCRLGRS